MLTTDLSLVVFNYPAWKLIAFCIIIYTMQTFQSTTFDCLNCLSRAPWLVWPKPLINQFIMYCFSVRLWSCNYHDLCTMYVCMAWVSRFKGPYITSCPLIFNFWRRTATKTEDGERQTRSIPKVEWWTEGQESPIRLQNGNTSAVRHFSKTLSITLNESTIRTWVKKYKEEREKWMRAGEIDLSEKVAISKTR